MVVQDHWSTTKVSEGSPWLPDPKISPSFHFIIMTVQTMATTPDMKDLLEALYHTVADKWEPIGIYLHLPMATLKAIAEERQHDPHKCLLGMLEVWVKRVDPPPTWSALIEAVKFLGEEQLGRELREKYCS